MVGNGMCKGTEAGQGMQHSHSACGLGRAGQVGPVPVLNSMEAEGPFFKPPGSYPAALAGLRWRDLPTLGSRWQTQVSKEHHAADVMDLSGGGKLGSH